MQKPIGGIEPLGSLYLCSACAYLPLGRVVTTELMGRIPFLVASDRLDRVCFLGIETTSATTLPGRATWASTFAFITQKPGLNIDYKLSKNALTVHYKTSYGLTFFCVASLINYHNFIL